MSKFGSTRPLIRSASSKSTSATAPPSDPSQPAVPLALTKIDPPIPPKPGETHHVVTNHTSGSRKINSLCARKGNVGRGFCAHQTLRLRNLSRLVSVITKRRALLACCPRRAGPRWAEKRLPAAAFREHQVKKKSGPDIPGRKSMEVRPSRALGGGEAGF
jgi:hypothetical protein